MLPKSNNILISKSLNNYSPVVNTETDKNLPSSKRQIKQKSKFRQNRFYCTENGDKEDILPTTKDSPVGVTKTSNLFEAFSRGVNLYRNAKIRVPTSNTTPPKHETHSHTHFNKLVQTKHMLQDIANKTTVNLLNPSSLLTANQLQSLKNKEIELSSKLVGAKRKSNEYSVAIEVYNEIKMNSISSPALISSLIEVFSHLGRWDWVISVVELMHSLKIPLNIRMYNALLGGYLKHNCPSAAYRLLEEIKESSDINEDVSTYNHFLDYHGRVGEFENIVTILTTMLGKNINPTHNTYTSIAISFAKFHSLESDNGDALRKLFSIIREYVGPDSTLMNTMIQCSSRANLQDEIDRIIEDMKMYKKQIDSHSYNHLIELYASESNIQKAEHYYNTLKMFYNPEIIAFNLMVEMYVKSGLWEKVNEIIEDAKNHLKRDDISVYNTLLSFSIRYGTQENVEYVLDLMSTRNLKFDSVTYTLFETNHLPLPEKKYSFKSLRLRNKDRMADFPIPNLASPVDDDGNIDSAIDDFTDFLMKEPDVVPSLTSPSSSSSSSSTSVHYKIPTLKKEKTESSAEAFDKLLGTIRNTIDKSPNSRLNQTSTNNNNNNNNNNKFSAAAYKQSTRPQTTTSTRTNGGSNRDINRSDNNMQFLFV